MIGLPPPNMRVQRTRSSPSAPHSPLKRRPLDRRIVVLGVMLLCLVYGLGTGESMGSQAGSGDSPAQKPVLVEGKCADLEPPVLTHRVEPRYPEYIRKQYWEGKVVLECIIGTDGTVSNITVKSSPGKPLSDLAMEAVNQWRYKPAYCKDQQKPVRVYLMVESTFRLNRKK